MKLYERIYELALQRSVFIPSNEPYGSVSGFYDYGPVGKLIKTRIENLFRQTFIRELGAHEVETSIITPEIVLKASGHTDSFTDPVVECTACKSKIRADSFVEAETGIKWDGKLASLDERIADKKLMCPSCKNGSLSPARAFNLMFATAIGGEQAPAYARPETAQGIFTAFLRLFRNHGAKLPLAIGQIGKSFRNEISPRKSLVRMREFTQMELEYFFNPANGQIEGFAQVAESKMMMEIAGQRVEKTARQLVDERIVPNEIMAWFLAKEWQFYLQCGLDSKRMYFRVLGDEERPHYSKGNIDLEVETSHGNIEINGNAYRTDYDLSRHAQFSGKDMSVFIEEDKTKLVPYVFEASLGVDRLIFCMLEHSYRGLGSGVSSPENLGIKTETGNSKYETGNMKPGSGNGKLETENPKPETRKDWEWFDFPPAVAPYHCAVFPLMKKDGLAEKAQAVGHSLRPEMDVYYQESGSIGRRYARADEIGIAYACTVDHQTLQDDTVTLRTRNDGRQERVAIAELDARIRRYIKENRRRLESM